jgi:transcriptional regulator of aromatic amino acid metabolism
MNLVELPVPKVDPNYVMRPEDDLLELILDLGMHPMIVGPHGTGKTFMAEQYAARQNKGLFDFSCDGSMSFREIVGHQSLDENRKLVFKEGLFIKALEQPSVIVLNEINTPDPSFNFTFHQILQSGKFYSIDANRWYEKHPDCKIIMTANENTSSYAGVRTMNTAFLDRVIIIYLEEYPLEEHKLDNKQVLNYLIQLRDKILHNDEGDIGPTISLSFRKINHWKKLRDKMPDADALKLAFVNQIRYVMPKRFDEAWQQLKIEFGITLEDTKKRRK